MAKLTGGTTVGSLQCAGGAGAAADGWSGVYREHFPPRIPEEKKRKVQQNIFLPSDLTCLQRQPDEAAWISLQ